MKTALSVLLLFAIMTPVVFAGTDVVRYQVPDIKNDFCGSVINFQYCKCAFHNEYCEAVDSNSSTAGSYVLSEFRAWNKERIQTMATSCLREDGYWNKSDWSCTKCTEGDLLKGTKCVPPEDVDPEARECREALKDIAADWEKYSDFDDRLGNDVSYEVQQFNKTLNEIAKLVALAQEIEYEMAIKADIRLEMRAYKEALVSNLRNNITKAIFRLTWVTYNTVQGARGTAGSVQKMLNPENAVEAVGATMKVIQSHIPPHEKGLQFNTASTSGKVASIAWNATLETIESVANPADIAKQGMKDVKSAIVGGPDLSQAEIDVLRDQHLSNKAVDKALAESYAQSAELRVTLHETEKMITDKYNQLQLWKLKEYQRVRGNLEDQCKEK